LHQWYGLCGWPKLQIAPFDIKINLEISGWLNLQRKIIFAQHKDAQQETLLRLMYVGPGK
jgi:hypothetical protein